VVRCPACGSEEIRPRPRSRLADLLAVVALRTPYRCRACWRPFTASRFRRSEASEGSHGTIAVGVRPLALRGTEPGRATPDHGLRPSEPR